MSCILDKLQPHLPFILLVTSMMDEYLAKHREHGRASVEIPHSAEWQIFIRFTDRKDSGVSEIQWALAQSFTPD
jgi:hypothetical protein